MEAKKEFSIEAILGVLFIPWDAPYTENKKGALASCTYGHKEYFKKTGVYLIQDLKGVLLYVGKSDGCVYRAAYRHFADWCKGKRVGGIYSDTWYDRSKVKMYIHICEDDDQDIVERMLAYHAQPLDNRILKKPPVEVLESFQFHQGDYDYIRNFELQNIKYD